MANIALLNLKNYYSSTNVAFKARLSGSSLLIRAVRLKVDLLPPTGYFSMFSILFKSAYLQIDK